MANDALPLDLRAAVEHLYEVFDGYRLTQPNPCPHCYSRREVEQVRDHLTTTALRGVDVEHVARFYADGLMTWGDADDFRYLLPRLMELFAMYHLGGLQPSRRALSRSNDLDPELSLARFPDAGWSRWPDAERAAVERYLWELWRAHIGQDRGPLVADHPWSTFRLLLAILVVSHEPQQYLDHWLTAGPGALTTLGAFIRWDAVDDPSWSVPDRDPMIGADRRGNPATQAIVREWIASAEVNRALAADAMGS